jgi:hypothetical protein
MTFSDLFVSKTKKGPFAEGAEGAKSQTNVMGGCVSDSILSRSLYIAENPRVQPSAPSAHIPLDQPFVEGERYREAEATEWPRRLDLYRADPTGPWVRQHGVLQKVSET